ncbi:RHTO0S03e00694g1_1 [Rhodotorula toruloides]|uniref:RHTO0S03e00694g1_1 n=1 Tax=Rhodotorula toruloides TaxID=5286 RepID=A0A061AK08_RHOTO|nr:RHTO0S03e00694g1_1 [Rhodotorula toruloides]
MLYKHPIAQSLDRPGTLFRDFESNAGDSEHAGVNDLGYWSNSLRSTDYCEEEEEEDTTEEEQEQEQEQEQEKAKLGQRDEGSTSTPPEVAGQKTMRPEMVDLSSYKFDRNDLTLRLSFKTLLGLSDTSPPLEAYLSADDIDRDKRPHKAYACTRSHGPGVLLGSRLEENRLLSQVQGPHLQVPNSPLPPIACFHLPLFRHVGNFIWSVYTKTEFFRDFLFTHELVEWAGCGYAGTIVIQDKNIKPVSEMVAAANAFYKHLCPDLTADPLRLAVVKTHGPSQVHSKLFRALSRDKTTLVETKGAATLPHKATDEGCRLAASLAGPSPSKTSLSPSFRSWQTTSSSAPRIGILR